jgi:hypothetical protein
MKDMINERLILLATAQECMNDVSDAMERWDSSQLILEKSAFESMNVTDKVLNLSKEGNQLVNRLQSSYRDILAGTKAEDVQKITVMLDEVQGLFKNILETSIAGNEISHNIEKETALQKEIEEGLKGCVNKVSESLDSAVACAEFMLAEI